MLLTTGVGVCAAYAVTVCHTRIQAVRLYFLSIYRTPNGVVVVGRHLG